MGDADLHALGVDVGLFQGNGFADAEAGGVDGGEDGAVFEVGWGGEDALDFVLAEDDGEGLFDAGPVDEVDFALAAEDAFVVEFDGVDGLVLVADGDFAFGYEVAEEGDDLVFVDPGNVEAVVEVDEFFEEAAVGLDGVGAVAEFLEFFDVGVGASAVIGNVVGGDAGDFGFVRGFFFKLKIKVLRVCSGFELEFDAFAVGGGPPFVFGVPAGVWDGFEGGGEDFVVGEEDAEAVVAGFDDQQRFFLEGSDAGMVGEVVGGLVDDGGEAGSEIVDDDFEVAFVMGYDPGFYARIPNGVAEGEDELDVGVVFGHAEDEAAGGDFEGDGVVGGRGWEKGGELRFV